MTSRARPIHQPPREIRREPDETEPSFSYEQESFLPKSEDEVEDEFHRRLTGTNFWRGGGEGPSFNSMNMKQQEERGSSGEADESATPRSVVTVGSPNALLPSSVSEKKKKRSQSWLIYGAGGISILMVSYINFHSHLT